MRSELPAGGGDVNVRFVLWMNDLVFYDTGAGLAWIVGIVARGQRI